jgi:hypothetical protein
VNVWLSRVPVHGGQQLQQAVEAVLLDRQKTDISVTVILYMGVNSSSRPLRPSS